MKIRYVSHVMTDGGNSEYSSTTIVATVIFIEFLFVEFHVDTNFLS